ncbi:MAG TPA: PEPxxWA-CTERM sorting domain-containing protein, partial [Roseiarcus sp.]
TGLTVLSFNLPYTVFYAYSDETLVVALQPSLQPSGVSCALSGSGSFCLFMSNPDGVSAPPETTQFNQVTGGDGSLWQAQSLETTVTPALSVPEPASWVLLIAGFAAVGFHLRARRAGGESWMRL